MQAAREPFMRKFLDILQDQFLAGIERSERIIRLTPPEALFSRPRQLERSMAMFSVGEYILRSGGAIEQTFGGITTRLWDDPFEWTLPEALNSPEAILAYLREVRTSVENGFAFLSSDDDLGKRLPAPERLVTIFELLTATLVRAEHFQGRATAILQFYSQAKPPTP